MHPNKTIEDPMRIPDWCIYKVPIQPPNRVLPLIDAASVPNWVYAAIIYKCTQFGKYAAIIIHSIDDGLLSVCTFTFLC